MRKRGGGSLRCVSTAANAEMSEVWGGKMMVRQKTVPWGKIVRGTGFRGLYGRVAMVSQLLRLAMPFSVQTK